MICSCFSTSTATFLPSASTLAVVCCGASLSVHRPTSPAHPQSHRAKEKGEERRRDGDAYKNSGLTGADLVHLVPTMAYFTLPRASRNTQGPPAMSHLSLLTGPHLLAFMATRPCRAAPPWRRDRRPPVADRPPINSVVAFYGVTTATGRRPSPLPVRAHLATGTALQQPARAVAAVRGMSGSDTPRSPHARVGAALPALDPAFVTRIHGAHQQARPIPVSPSISHLIFNAACKDLLLATAADSQLRMHCSGARNL
jgi:hypothetical protein